jgi:branched-chain amino acid transport system permease protein
VAADRRLLERVLTVTSYLLTGLLSGAAYGLLAMGFVLIYRGTRIFNLAQGELGGLGLYVAWMLLGVFPTAVAAFVGVVVAALTGVVMERVLIRRVVDQAPLAGVAVTLGAALTLAYTEARLWGLNVKTFPSPVGTWSVSLGSFTATAPRVVALLAAVGAAIGLALLLRRTTFGLASRAATADQSLARVSGIDVNRVRATTWAIAGALSGVSALLLAPVVTFHPLSNTLVLVRALAAALLGGLTSLTGALVGGLTIGIVEGVVVSQTGQPGAVDAAVLVAILGTLLFRPQGLFGAAES